MAENEVLQPLLVHLRIGALNDSSEGLLHAVNQDLEPALHVSLDNHWLLKLDLLPTRMHLGHCGWVGESDRGQRVKETRLEVRLHCRWV